MNHASLLPRRRSEIFASKPSIRQFQGPHRLVIRRLEATK